MTQIDTSHAGVGGKPGFTLWPAQSPAGQFATDNGGTEYLMSSDAGDEAQCDSGEPCEAGTGTSTNLLVWNLTNTSSLDTASPAPSLSMKVLTVGQYGIPPKSNQKPGDFPLGQCLNDDPCATFLNGAPDPFKPEVISHLDSNDTRMQQTWFANGKLWGALDTALTVEGQNKAGIEYFIVNPSAGKVLLGGYLGLAGNNLTYPAIATTPSGRGVMAFTVVGDDHYPSAGYSGIDAEVGAGDIHIASEGLGVSDGFTSYSSTSVIRLARVGATTGLPPSTGTASGSHPSRSSRPARLPSSSRPRSGAVAARAARWATGAHGSARSRRSSPPLIEKSEEAACGRPLPSQRGLRLEQSSGWLRSVVRLPFEPTAVSL